MEVERGFIGEQLGLRDQEEHGIGDTRPSMSVHGRIRAEASGLGFLARTQGRGALGPTTLQGTGVVEHAAGASWRGTHAGGVRSRTERGKAEGAREEDDAQDRGAEADGWGPPMPRWPSTRRARELGCVGRRGEGRRIGPKPRLCPAKLGNAFPILFPN